MKISILTFFIILPFAFSDLQFGFYSSSCPKAEDIVSQVVQSHFAQNRTIPAALLRMHFHDCFVSGCDASILIDPDPSKNRTSEKTAAPNLTVRGYDLIDDIKSTLEQTCPSTVSCADIITLATRDAVALAGGPRYNVSTGRRDGLLSDPALVNKNIPGPFASVSQAQTFFTYKGLTLEDMVTLLGAHTVGVAHCSSFEQRISSFNGRIIDPTMDPTLDPVLVKVCGSSSSPAPYDPAVVLEENTPEVFDNMFYKQILKKRAILHIDQQLTLDPSTSNMVSSFAADGDSFQRSFANAIIKLGNIDVVVGNDGEIRKNCKHFNNPSM